MVVVAAVVVDLGVGVGVDVAVAFVVVAFFVAVVGIVVFVFVVIVQLPVLTEARCPADMGRDWTYRGNTITGCRFSKLSSIWGALRPWYFFV